MSGGALPLRTTRQMLNRAAFGKTEATGAPQTSSYTKSVSWQHPISSNSRQGNLNIYSDGALKGRSAIRLYDRFPHIRKNHGKPFGRGVILSIL
jgi:hypothetical protein